MRDDDYTLQWFKEYVQWCKSKQLPEKYLEMLDEMVEICTPKQEKYSWEK